MSAALDPAAAAKGLTKAQRAFILAASARPKKWWSIKRHAKIDHLNRMRPIQNLDGLLTGDNPYTGRWHLTPLGLAVRAHLMETDHA